MWFSEGIADRLLSMGRPKNQLFQKNEEEA